MPSHAQASRSSSYCLRSDVRLAPDRSSADAFVVSFGNGASRAALSISPLELAGWLLSLAAPRPYEELVSLTTSMARVTADGARQLLDSLISEGAMVPASDARMTDGAREWIRLGWSDALDFHSATSDLGFQFGDDMSTELYDLLGRDEAQGMTQPGPFKEYDGSFIRLPKELTASGNTAFGEVLLRRRTSRSFAAKEMTLDELGELAFLAFGQTGHRTDTHLGEQILRTSPSGGARHPVEAYFVVNSVQSVAPGIYHYSVKSHGLSLLRAGNFGAVLEELSHRQARVSRACVNVLLTARWGRHMWKYRYARSYRMVLFDVAHVAQTFLLTATALGFRTFLTPALMDSKVNDLLDLQDPYVECALYLVAAG